jgi:hypothetical protein
VWIYYLAADTAPRRLEREMTHVYASDYHTEGKLIYLAVDAGTTNTTVWLMKDKRILRQCKQPVGVQQTSIRGNRELLESTLRRTLRSLSQRAPSPPRFVLAAGIVPHFTGPIATAALVHSLGTFSGPLLMEYNFEGRPLPHLRVCLDFKNGKLYPNDRPGLGVELEISKLTQILEVTKYDTNRAQTYFRPDGSITNW